jgi:uncharacterized protein DUF3617
VRVPKWILAGAMAVPLMALADDSVQMTPGRWQETPTVTKVLRAGVPVPLEVFSSSQEKARFSCLSPAEAKNPTLYFMEHTPGDNCSTPQGSVASGRIAMSAQCKLKDTSAPASISVEGTYAQQSYHTVIKALATFNNTPMEINFDIDGKFVGPCKGDEE